VLQLRREAGLGQGERHATRGTQGSTAAREMMVRVRVPSQGRHHPGGADVGVGAQLQLGRLDMLAADTATSSRVGIFDPWRL
jgi:hypothetical protein